MPKLRILARVPAVRPVLALLAFVLLLPLLVAAFPGEAEAHATLISSEPSDNTVVETPPRRISLSFSEPVKVMSLTLATPSGATAPLSQPATDGGTVTIEVPEALAQGTHALRYRIVSADGHPVGGSILFSVGAPSGAPGRGDAPDWPVAAFVFATKLLLYLGLFVGVGGLAYGLAFGPMEAGARRAVQVFLVIGLVSLPLALGAQGLDALGAPIGQFFLGDAWAAGAETAFARTLVFAGFAFALGLAATTRGDGITFRLLAGTAIVCLGLSLAVAGHASNAPPQWATRPAVFLHAVSIAVWIGSLLPLAVAVQNGRSEGRVALRRFSATIPYVLIPLVASGVLLAVVQTRQFSALLDTAYGVILLVKLALVAALLLLAAANRWSLTEAVAGGGDPSARERMVGTIGMELALALLILSAVTLWRFTPPPRALQEAAAQPALAHLVTGGLTGDLTVTPGHAGEVVITASFATIDYVPVAPSAVSFEFSQPGSGVAPIRLEAKKPADGAWTAEGTLPIAGRWQVRIDIRTDGASPATLDGTLDLRAK